MRKLTREERKMKVYADAKSVLALRKQYVAYMKSEGKEIPLLTDDEKRIFRNAWATIWRFENPDQMRIDAERRKENRVTTNRNRRKRYKQFLKENEEKIKAHKEQLRKKREIEKNKTIITVKSEIDCLAAEFNLPTIDKVLNLDSFDHKKKYRKLDSIRVSLKAGKIPRIFNQG